MNYRDWKISLCVQDKKLCKETSFFFEWDRLRNCWEKPVSSLLIFLFWMDTEN